MAQSGYDGKRVQVEILTDTFKIRGTLFVPLAGKGGYSSRLSDLFKVHEALAWLGIPRDEFYQVEKETDD